MARTMTLNDGGTLELKMCGLDGDLLCFVPLGGLTLAELAEMLSRPEATAHIEVAGSERVDTYDGFTELVGLNALIDPAGVYTVLRKEGD